jgi:HopA1 effector protein family
MFDTFLTIANSLEWKDSHFLLRGSCSAVSDLLLYPSTALQLETLSKLTECLYANYYAFDPNLFRDQPNERVFNVRRWRGDPEYVKRLKAANPGVGYQSKGWEVTGMEAAGGLFVKKNGITLFVNAKQLVYSCNHAVGDVISVLFPSESTYGMPGFFLYFGDAGPSNRSGCTRFYLNLVPDFAPRVIRYVLEALRHDEIPHTLKVVNGPALFTRRDNTVLYVQRELFSRAVGIVLDVKRLVPEGFRDASPSLTFPLSAGIAAADNPSPTDGAESGFANVSFGLHRMQLLAKGIGEAVAKGVRSRDEIVGFMRAAFEDAGIDPERPYLNSKDSEDYFSPHLDKDGLR